MRHGHWIFWGAFAVAPLLAGCTASGLAPSVLEQKLEQAQRFERQEQWLEARFVWRGLAHLDARYERDLQRVDAAIAEKLRALEAQKPRDVPARRRWALAILALDGAHAEARGILRSAEAASGYRYQERKRAESFTERPPTGQSGTGSSHRPALALIKRASRWQDALRLAEALIGDDAAARVPALALLVERAEGLWRAGDARDAAELLLAVRALQPTGAAQDRVHALGPQVGEQLARDGHRLIRSDIPAAIALWRLALRLDPDHENLIVHLARAERMNTRLERLRTQR